MNPERNSGSRSNRMMVIMFAIMAGAFFVYYALELLRREQSRFMLVKIGASLLLPLPLLLMLAFFITHRLAETDAEIDAPRLVWLAGLLFPASMVLTVALMVLVQWACGYDWQRSLLPLCINTTTASLYIFNFFVIRSLWLAGLLSGVCLGVTLKILFFP